MPHKTLLIGLGSSGAEIVSEVMDRVVARFGSMEAAPWVEVVRIDKAKGIFEPTGFDLSLLKRRVIEDPVTHKRKRCRNYKLVRMPREEESNHNG